MTKKKKSRPKFRPRSKSSGSIAELNEFFQCDLRPDNWPAVIRAKASEIGSPVMAELLRSYIERYRDQLDFDWAKLYLSLVKETMVKEDARRVLQLAEALSKYPPFYLVKLEVAEIYKTVEGRLRQAKELYEELIALDDRVPYGHHYLGLVLFSLGLYERAGEAFQQAIALCDEAKEDAAEIKARAHYNLGALIEGFYRRHFEAARKHLDEALRLMPDYPQAQTMLKHLEARGHLFINVSQGLRGKLLDLLRPKPPMLAGDVRLLSHWYPTDVAAHRYLQMQCERWANLEIEALGGRTPYAAALDGLSFREIMDAYGFRVKDPSLLKLYQEALRVDPPALSRERVYQVSGGLLNLFNEPARAEEDRQWRALIGPLANSSASPEAVRRAMTVWREQPNELFSHMTPAQVWAGGGAQEGELAEQFMEELTAYFDDRSFATDGEMIGQALGFLRQWLLSPRRGTRGPSRQEVILKERTVTVEQKTELLKRKGLLETSFLA